MNKHLIFFAVVGALCLPIAADALNSLWSDEIPPARFQGEGEAITFLLAPGDVRRVCSSPDENLPAGMQILACSFQARDNKAWVTVLPNPCAWAQQEEYARLACHEKGHTLGWSKMHEE